jgi:hypothetical protein
MGKGVSPYMDIIVAAIEAAAAVAAATGHIHHINGLNNIIGLAKGTIKDPFFRLVFHLILRGYINLTVARPYIKSSPIRAAIIPPNTNRPFCY